MYRTRRAVLMLVSRFGFRRAARTRDVRRLRLVVVLARRSRFGFRRAARTPCCVSAAEPACVEDRAEKGVVGDCMSC